MFGVNIIIIYIYIYTCNLETAMCSSCSGNSIVGKEEVVYRNSIICVQFLVEDPPLPYSADHNYNVLTTTIYVL